MLAALLLLYLALLFGVALGVHRRHGAQREPRLYFIAGGTLSTPVTAFSLTATSVGGSSTVVAAALVYRHGLPGIWIDLAGSVGYLLLGLLVARRVRQSGVASIAELAGRRHGPAVRRLAAWAVVIAEVAWLALLTRAAAALLQPALPQLPPAALLGLFVGVVVAYTLAGGQLAVSYTDLLQLAVMILGLCVVAPLGLAGAVGDLGRLRFPVGPGFGWDRVGTFLLLTGLPHLVGSDIYAKVLSAADGRAAARGALIASGLKVIVAAAVAFVALCGRLHCPELERPELVLSTMIQQALSPAVAAIVLLALTATMMSSADQVLLSALTMIGNDLCAPAARRGPRAALALLLGGAALLIAASFPTVVDLMQVAYSFFAGGLALPVLLAVVPRVPLHRAGVVAAIAVGGGTAAGLHLWRLGGGRPWGEPVVWGVGLNLLLLLGAWLAGRPWARPRTG